MLYIFLGLIGLFIILGLIVFLISFPFEKKAKTLLDPVRKKIVEKDEQIDLLVEKFLSEYETPLIDLTPYLKERENNAQPGQYIFLQQTITLIIKKDIYNEKVTPSTELEKLLADANSFEDYEKLVKNYNKYAMTYNSLHRFFFAKPYFLIAKKRKFPLA